MTTIIIVEDDAGVRESLALSLKLEGYTVLEASPASSGLRCMAQQFDLVILDVLLRGSS